MRGRAKGPGPTSSQVYTKLHLLNFSATYSLAMLTTTISWTKRCIQNICKIYEAVLVDEPIELQTKIFKKLVFSWFMVVQVEVVWFVV